MSLLSNIKRTKYKRTKSICETIYYNAVHIVKPNVTNGIIVFYTERYTCIISDTKKVDDIPLFLLIKEYTIQSPNDNPYEHWTHAIGKQIKKDETSKYFRQDESIHFKNGSFNIENKAGLSELILEAQRLIKIL